MSRSQGNTSLQANMQGAERLNQAFKRPRTTNGDRQTTPEPSYIPNESSRDELANSRSAHNGRRKKHIISDDDDDNADSDAADFPSPAKMASHIMIDMKMVSEKQRPKPNSQKQSSQKAHAGYPSSQKPLQQAPRRQPSSQQALQKPPASQLSSQIQKKDKGKGRALPEASNNSSSSSSQRPAPVKSSMKQALAKPSVGAASKASTGPSARNGSASQPPPSLMKELIEAQQQQHPATQPTSGRPRKNDLQQTSTAPPPVVKSSTGQDEFRSRSNSSTTLAPGSNEHSQQQKAAVPHVTARKNLGNANQNMSNANQNLSITNHNLPAINQTIQAMRTEEQALSELNILCRRYFLTFLSNQYVDEPIAQIFPGLKTDEPVYKVARLKVQNSYKTWKANTLKDALAWVERWIAGHRQPLDLTSVTTYDDLKKVARAEFEPTWLEDIFKFGIEAVDFTQISRPVFRFLRYSFITLTITARLTKLHESAPFNPELLKYTRLHLLNVFDSLHKHNEFTGRLSVDQVPERVIPRTVQHKRPTKLDINQDSDAASVCDSEEDENGQEYDNIGDGLDYETGIGHGTEDDEHQGGEPYGDEPNGNASSPRGNANTDDYAGIFTGEDVEDDGLQTDNGFEN